MMPCVLTIAIVFIIRMCSPLQAQTLVSFPTADSGLVYADLYGKGEHGIVLAHGGRFNKKSWELQAKALAAAMAQTANCLGRGTIVFKEEKAWQNFSLYGIASKKISAG